MSTRPMFICVSPNPAVDKRLEVASVVPGQVVRARSAQSFPGGKCAHVAMVLRTLGESAHWIGPCGGRTGAELLDGLSALGIQTIGCFTAKPTRTNLEIIEDSGQVTEILEPGSAPWPAELSDFEAACGKLFAEGGNRAWAIFSGSLPSGVAPDLYGRLITRARTCGCHTVLDTSGEALRMALPSAPDLVKPNREEAAHLLGGPIHLLSDAARAARTMVSLGARRASISLGQEGLLLCSADETNIWFAPALSLPTRSPVGCGDSALAGFVHAFAHGRSSEEALHLAAACAAANCVADSPGAARFADIQKFRGEIRVQSLSSGSSRYCDGFGSMANS